VGWSRRKPAAACVAFSAPAPPSAPRLPDEATWPALVACLKAPSRARFDYVNGGRRLHLAESLINLRSARAADPDIVGSTRAPTTSRTALWPRGGCLADDRHELAGGTRRLELIEKNLRAARPRTRRADAASTSGAGAESTSPRGGGGEEGGAAVLVSATPARRQPPRQRRGLTSFLWMPYMALGSVLDGFDAWTAPRRWRREGCSSSRARTDPWDPAHLADSATSPTRAAACRPACAGGAAGLPNKRLSRRDEAQFPAPPAAYS
jgi:hypothetical protein